MKLQVKSELSWPADNSVLTPINLTGQLVFKHMEERGRTTSASIIFFSSAKVFFYQINLQNKQKFS